MKLRRIRRKAFVEDPETGKVYHCRGPEEEGWIEMLRVLFLYDPETGIMTRRIKFNKSGDAGSVVGVPSIGYLRVTVFGKSMGVHVVAWALMMGKWPGLDIDHINGRRSDNRWINLRQVLRKQNLWNMGRNKLNTSGFRGVSWNGALQRWHAYISITSGSIRRRRLPGKPEAGRRKFTMGNSRG